MKCEKCGGKIDPKGRYCMECFEPVTSYSPADEENKPIPMKTIFVGAAALVVAIIVIVVLSLRTMPPEKVTLEWLEACATANGLRAMRYTTPEFEGSSGLDRKLSYEKIDEYAADRRETGLTFTAHQPTYNNRRRPTVAEVRVTFHYGKSFDYDRYFVLRKAGRDWKIDGTK